MDLFEKTPNTTANSKSLINTPLAERARPKKIEDFIGHKNIVGPDTVLYQEIKQNRIKSIVLWGPPGIGKTTLAKVISNEVKADFISISAVTSGVADIRKVIDRAEKNRKHLNKTTILFIDEIHRFNKAQQDALLHAVEDGTIILIGATTENPSFEVIAPLLSRCQVYQMKILSNDEIQKIVEIAYEKDVELSQLNIKINDWEVLLKLANGDARRALNIIEKSIDIIGKKNKLLNLDKSLFEKVALQKILYYDKAGEYHYDLISAFIKSLRGSDPDAAIYWMARMLEGGEDPKFIARRMLILAAEDIGNADPYALTLATSCFTAITYIGMPESKIILSQTAAYLAAAPKSNSAITAINKAIEDVKRKPDIPVPLHLRNAPTSLLSDLGYGDDYKYAHDFPNHFIKENYLPSPFEKELYYIPSSMGDEKNIRERLKKLWAGIKEYPTNTDTSKKK
jgi:putative ATPase